MFEKKREKGKKGREKKEKGLYILQLGHWARLIRLLPDLLAFRKNVLDLVTPLHQKSLEGLDNPRLGLGFLVPARRVLNPVDQVPIRGDKVNHILQRAPRIVHGSHKPVQCFPEPSDNSLDHQIIIVMKKKKRNVKRRREERTKKKGKLVKVF